MCTWNLLCTQRTAQSIRRRTKTCAVTREANAAAPWEFAAGPGLPRQELTAHTLRCLITQRLQCQHARTPPLPPERQRGRKRGRLTPFMPRGASLGRPLLPPAGSAALFLPFVPYEFNARTAVFSAVQARPFLRSPSRTFGPLTPARCRPPFLPRLEGLGQTSSLTTSRAASG